MTTRQTKGMLAILAASLATVLAAASLTGCQASGQTGAESLVYRHFDKWSRSIPEGMVATPAEEGTGDQPVYEYRDVATVLGGGSRKRMVRGVLGTKSKELWLVDTTPPKKGGIRFLGFISYDVEFDLTKHAKMEAAGPLISDRMFIVQNKTEAVVYFREKATSVWQRCRLPGNVWSALVPEHCADCLRRAEQVPTGHVQRYIDLADRFYKTYFFID